jgi:hypothetical protein
MVAVAERRARPKAERLDRPLRDGRVFLHHFPALRTGLLSLSPSRLRPPGYGGQAGTRASTHTLEPFLTQICRRGTGLGFLGSIPSLLLSTDPFTERVKPRSCPPHFISKIMYRGYRSEGAGSNFPVSSTSWPTFFRNDSA